MAETNPSSASESFSDENAANATARIPATVEGMAVAYGSLVIMALLPIFFGSYRSVKHHKEQKESGEIPDTMSHKDAAMFPLIASAALFGLYCFFQVFSKAHINLLLTGYFFFLGILALSHLLSPVISSLVPAAIPNVPYRIHFAQLDRGEESGREHGEGREIISYCFTSHDVVCLACCTLVGAWYLMEKHWIANNLLGIAFAINGVELLHLNNMVTGCILLCGLFFYDIFWVFGTNVMVTVAKAFEAPIKLVFPQDLLERGLEANNFAMLGLGDVVIPGIFIALLLRFDHSLKRNSNIYFYVTFAAYLLGLLLTIFMMHISKHAQPALLYLVPSCIGTPLIVALIRGDVKAMFQYEDHPTEEEEVPAESNSKSKKDE
ncbi:minor histocompatibility antigen H13 [Ischnura elegans]|uniref:minor histocompatibility antigen H13 n=1 Tax=Ischnura elegans TaxID=197161 RepID=UPI001ED8AB8C|nr:minor histocompatibility antigen H13 [Ischnura elegans]